MSQKKDFTIDEIMSNLIQITSIPEAEKEYISLLTLRESLKYLEGRGIIKGNERFHLNREQIEDLPPEISRVLFYHIFLRYFRRLIFE
jgi:hypothetical protein